MNGRDMVEEAILMCTEASMNVEKLVMENNDFMGVKEKIDTAVKDLADMQKKIFLKTKGSTIFTAAVLKAAKQLQNEIGNCSDANDQEGLAGIVDLANSLERNVSVLKTKSVSRNIIIT